MAAVIVVVLAVWVLTVLRRVRRSEANLTASRRLLDVELTRRYDQTDALVAATRAAGMDSDIVAPLAGARSLALGVRDQGLTLGDQAGSENALSVALHRVIAAATQDPNVKNDWTVGRPVLDLRTTEQRLAGAARVYNDHAGARNALLRGVGTGVIARILGARPAPLFEAAHAEPAAELGEGAAV
ncbi:LemA family protein [Rhodococcus sp. NPDC003318]|uniref:LemA family protein n=1 Tax=Rhodococcus sp. NPDC003318 TaxID=3364503 RepID=UPI0036AD6A0B